MAKYEDPKDLSGKTIKFDNKIMSKRTRKTILTMIKEKKGFLVYVKNQKEINELNRLAPFVFLSGYTPLKFNECCFNYVKYFPSNEYSPDKTQNYIVKTMKYTGDLLIKYCYPIIYLDSNIEDYYKTIADCDMRLDDEKSLLELVKLQKVQIEKLLDIADKHQEQIDKLLKIISSWKK